MSLTFEALAARKKNLLAWLRKDKANLEGVLVGIYEDRTHFLYELVQNAEDAGASKVAFELERDRLTVSHDGVPFTIDDVEGVTGVGVSTKAADSAKLGRFGIGFKSVFAVTDAPEVRSGEYHFRVEDLIVPVRIGPGGESSATVIELPFKEGTASPYAEILERLRAFGAETLLFLESIAEIEWFSPEEGSDGQGVYRRRTAGHPSPRRDAGGLAATLVTRVSVESGGGTGTSFLRVAKRVGGTAGAKGSRSVAVAYRLVEEGGVETVVPEPNAPLSVFFPTAKPTYLPMRTQGPFRTTPNRENVPLGDADNEPLLGALADVIAESVIVLRDEGYLDLDVLSHLPLEPDPTRGELYEAAHRAVRGVLEQEAVWPALGGGYVRASDAALAETASVASVLSGEDLEGVAQRRVWLSDRLARTGRTAQLREFVLVELRVPEVRMDRVVEALTGEFMAGKSDDWIVLLYHALKGRDALWRRTRRGQGALPVLLNKPFIRTESGRHVRPFEHLPHGVVPRVYLPPEGETGFEVVSRAVAADAEALEFLVELGLDVPDVQAEVRENILPRYLEGSEEPPPRYADDWEKVVAAYDAAEGMARTDLTKRVQEAYIVHVEKGPMLRPGTAYFASDDLRAYFGDAGLFVTARLLGIPGAKKVLEVAGVATAPRRLPIESSLDEETRRRLRGRDGASEEQVVDYDYDGLENFLLRPRDRQGAVLLWDMLCMSAKEHVSFPPAFFQATYRYKYYTQKTRTFAPAFVKQLNAEAWLFRVEGGTVRPCDLSAGSLAEGYDTVSPQGEALVRALSFQSEARDRLRPEERAILDFAKGRSPEDVQRGLALLEAVQEGVDEDEPWNPAVPPDEVSPEIHDYEPESKQGEEGADDARDQAFRRFGGGRRGRDGKEVGAWGERVVYDALQRRGHGEVVWLNEYGDKGVGHDLRVVVEGEAVEFVEVKSSRDTGPVTISLSAAQWELATRLEASTGKGKFVVYVVRGAGEANASITRIESPVRSLMAGEIRAGAVELQVPE